MTKLWCLIFWMVFLLPAPAAELPAKLIYYGWDNPPISALPEVLPKLDKSPFDGMAVMATQHTELFTTQPLPAADFADDLVLLKQNPNWHLRSSYLLIHAAAEDTFDWTNDQHWAAVQQNLKLYNQLLKAGNFKGIVFDMEPYGKNPWSFDTQKNPSALSFDGFSKLLRNRGQDMMATLRRELPEVEIWGLYGLSAIEADAPTNLQHEGYGLWPSFFNGWIDASGPQTKIIDGNEPSYYYTKRQEFFDAQTKIVNDRQRLLAPESRETYAKIIRLGQAIYVDGVMNASRSPRFIGYYFKTEAGRLALLKSNIQNALHSSQSLVWIYSEIPKWWEAEPIAPIDQAIRQAKADLETPLYTDETAMAVKALNERISIGGKITDKYGKGIKPTSFKPEIANVACSSWGDEGSYGCDFPKGSSVIVEPIVESKTITPRRVTRSNLTKSDWDVNFTVQ